MLPRNAALFTAITALTLTACFSDGGRGFGSKGNSLADTGTTLPPGEAALRSAVEAAGPPERLVLAGKSMGGRVASMFVDELGCRGLVCLGYPFHPPGRPEKLRTAHLLELSTPALFLQGERDPFGTLEQVPGYGLSNSIELCWLPDGDHGLRPRKRSGHSEEGNLALAVQRADDFLRGLLDVPPIRS